MENPLELAAPNDVLEQVSVFAFDLAYGVVHKLWSSRFWITYAAGGAVHWRDWEHKNGDIDQYLKNKWNAQPPSHHLMTTFGFIELKEKDVYLLTPKAFALLEKQARPPSVFISYKQTESSALALLVESRLKNVDENVSIFIDKNIDSGESINSRIEEALKQSRYFICLLGTKTLSDSPAVKTEINLAQKNTDCTVIPICHSGYTPDDVYSQHFGDNKAIIIKQPDSAEEYETNMTKLLIRLGYSTI